MNCKEIALSFKWFRMLKDSFFTDLPACCYLPACQCNWTPTGTPALCKISDFSMKTLALNPNHAVQAVPVGQFVYGQSLCANTSVCFQQPCTSEINTLTTVKFLRWRLLQALYKCIFKYSSLRTAYPWNCMLLLNKSEKPWCITLMPRVVRLKEVFWCSSASIFFGDFYIYIILWQTSSVLMGSNTGVLIAIV